MKKKKLLLSALLLSMASSFSVSANENAFKVDCTPVELADQWQDYYLETDAYAYCPLTLDSNGRLELSFQTTFDSMHYVSLLDENYEKINSTSVHGEGEAAPVTVNYSYDLTAGTYYARVESINDCHGLFRIKASFTPSLAPDPDGGKNFASAVPYQLSDITGFLSSRNVGSAFAASLPKQSQNFEDYYRFDTQGGTYEIQLNTLDPEASVLCEIYTSSYQLAALTVRPPSESIDLSAGTYYFCVESDTDRCGDYCLRIELQED